MKKNRTRALAASVLTAAAMAVSAGAANAVSIPVSTDDVQGVASTAQHLISTPDSSNLPADTAGKVLPASHASDANAS
ncbi:hypothetical protein [Streptomyces albidoflavus]|uniref:hypothetical protein n=1 Tax=Streptomyces albidoflavus TaxID=1886 RepID=UPI00101F1ACC|nr:hypothetical protein [Streptomyces albidoflavus]RZF02685.1 hypothetical protein C0R05_32680 [Streptomyces albidoflavus]